MATDRPSKSPSPIPTTEFGQDGSTVTDSQWAAMQTVLSFIYQYRTPEGEDPSKLFQRKVNKRVLPDYYSVIKEPMALSTIKANIHSKVYKSFEAYVRDFALVSHNAQVYNRPDSGAYQDALIIKDVLEKELAKLVRDNVITAEQAKLPFLGEIPTQEDIIMEEVEEEDDADPEASDVEEEEDEDDDVDDSDEEGGKRKRRKATRGTGAITKREKKKDVDKEDDDPESRKKRGRPPRVDTPMEARIKEILKGMRKFKNSSNTLMVYHFERLPDKAVMPEYYNEVKTPMALDMIKKKLKRKKYTTVEQCMKDLETMFENAKSYNQDESQVYKDAVYLQKETKKLADEVKAKPDTDYVMEDGRLPMPDGILHNGELWKVGDWVHIQNANDLTKPIVAQIYRTWQDQDGAKWINACWYYRPEQTVHRYDRHFFEDEVVKTGQYRDHPIDEIVDRCFVMFFTRYNKGRPRNFPADKEIYVCEARYNEEKHKLNKIKTWASCLPDEVRDKDYEMDLFETQKKMKKVPSPIKYLFKEDEQKESDELPKPVWGAPNAPPKIGAVHMRPRDPKDSPPPEPTPTPPPPPPPPAPRPAMPTHSSSYNSEHRPSNISISGANMHQQSNTHTPLHPQPTPANYTPSHRSQYQTHSASPAPLQPMPPQQQGQFHPSPLTPHSSYKAPAPVSQVGQYSTPQSNYAQPRGAMPPASGYNAALPPPIEVWHLPDSANGSIPEDLRSQFQCDEAGRILFFTAPPAASEPRTQLGHTAKYLAYKSKREEMLREKRKADALSYGNDGEARKRAKSEESVLRDKIKEQARLQALEVMEDALADATVAEFRAIYGEGWKEAMERELQELERKQGEAEKSREERERVEGEWKRKERDALAIRGLGANLELAVKR
ncbi:putative transcription initiation factor TFIID subunit [Venturia inaequalis]|nr:putative transcription initiation factor TFIID subunit [Venturia inaequalis]